MEFVNGDEGNVSLVQDSFTIVVLLLTDNLPERAIEKLKLKFSASHSDWKNDHHTR